MTLPSHAQIVVIGGGIIGCSTAYHLARDHKADVVLLEQGKITSGSTWHAAGLVGQLRSSASITKVLKYSVDLYKGLAAETGLATGWKMTGCLRLATTPDRWTEFKRLATTARSFGMEMHLVSPAEVKRMWPLMDVSDLSAQAGCRPTGRPAPPTSPSRWPRARACTARRSSKASPSPASAWTAPDHPCETTGRHRLRQGGELRRHVGAAGRRDGGRQRAAAAGQAPVYRHREDPGLAPDAATLRDPDRRTYFKEEVGGLVMGGYEPNPQAWTTGDVPDELGVPAVRR
jgi:sarcosine dehydrogenase